MMRSRKQTNRNNWHSREPVLWLLELFFRDSLLKGLHRTRPESYSIICRGTISFFFNLMSDILIDLSERFSTECVM